MGNLVFLLSDVIVLFQRYRFLAALREIEDRFGVCLLTAENSPLYQDLWDVLDEQKGNISYVKVREGRQFPNPDTFVIRAKECMKGIKVPSLVGELPFWKFTLFDDFRGSISETFHEIPSLVKESRGVLIPLFPFNRSPFFGNYYSYQLYKTAKDLGIPVIGVEIQSLDKRYYYHNLFYDFYILKHQSSKEFLLEIGVENERIFLLKEKYKFIFSESEFPLKVNLKFVFDDLTLILQLIREGYFIIALMSCLSERYAIRRFLRVATKLDKKIAIVAVAHPDIYTISLSEKEVLEKSFIDELRGNEFSNFFILETPRTNLSFLTLFADIIVSADPQLIYDIPYLPDNVIVYNPLCSRSKRFFPDIKNFYTEDEGLESFIRCRLERSRSCLSFKEAIETILSS